MTIKNIGPTIGLALTVAMLLGQSAAGQNTSPPSPPAPLIIDPKACLDQERVGPGALKETLSEKLERSEGIICPPLSVDPEIAVAPPGGGKTPVIPPPGSPGGDPSVRPK
jgi:hypothetical protein